MKKVIFAILLVIVSLKSFSQDLNSVIVEALENSPKIKAYDLSYNISTEKIEEASYVPNTELGIGYSALPIETRTGAQVFNISLKQMIPWFGTVSYRKKYSKSLSEIEYINIEIAKNELISSVSNSYYNLYDIKSKINILEENIKLIKLYITLSSTSMETGNIDVIDILKLETKKEELKKNKKILELNYKSELSVINNLLNRDNKTEIIFPYKLEIPQNDSIIQINNLSINYEIIKYDKIYESVESMELLNKKNKKPLIGLGFNYIMIDKRSDVINLSNNGRDAFIPSLFLSIPLFNKKYNSITKQNKIKLQEIDYQKKDRLNTLNIILDKAINTIKSSRIDYNTQLKNMYLVGKAENILKKNYESGKADFNKILDLLELKLNFEMNKIRAVTEYFKQVVIINYLTNKKMKK